MISYRNIAAAIEFYAQCGYREIDVPWTAPMEAISVTLPSDMEATNSDVGFLVGSAEQSLLACVATRSIKGKFQATTPCFRNEAVDDIHKKYFMKTELFINDVVNEEILEQVLKDALRFFGKYTFPSFLALGPNKFDIIDYRTGIELGSYGIGSHPVYGDWVYGTGVAEPRLTYVMRKNLEK